MTTDEEHERQGKLLATHYIPETAAVYIYGGCVEVSNVSKGDASDPTVYVKKFYDDLFDEAKGNAERTVLHLQSGELFSLFTLLSPPGTQIPGSVIRHMAKPAGINAWEAGWERVDGMDLYQRVIKE